MIASSRKLLMLAAICSPWLASGAWADSSMLAAELEDPFAFGETELDRIRFTRADDSPVSIIPKTAGSDALGEIPLHADRRQTEFSFKLKARLPEFSREGAFGLNLFRDPRLDIRQTRFSSVNIGPLPSGLHHGFEYSAGFTIEHEDEQIDGTAYVSSSLLGLSYGRLGRLWYGGFDVNLEQFVETETGQSQPDVLSVDVTTGRRLGFTGLEPDSPLWLLSVQGNLEVGELESRDNLESGGDWYLNPSLLWKQPGFTFSAQMQVPVEFENLDEDGKPDYRLRAVFEKQFK